MRYTYAISALRHKRARLAGEIEAGERALAGKREELAALDATLRLFHPDADPEALRSIRPTARGVYFRHGERPRLCVEAIRDAGGLVTTGRIIDYVMKAKGMERGIRSLLHGFVHRTLTRLEVRGKVRRIVSEDGGETWWEIV